MSLKFVDKVYKNKHPESHREYYPPLSLRPNKERVETSNLSSVKKGVSSSSSEKQSSGSMFKNLKSTGDKSSNSSAYSKKNVSIIVKQIKEYINSIPSGIKTIHKNKPFQIFVRRSLTRAGFSMAIYLLSFLPIVGGFVMPAVSFYSFNKVVGTPTAVAIFAVGSTAPRRWMVKFLSTFWGGRSLVRELLAPYLNRVPYSKAEREHWFMAREGIMFGFGAVFYLFIKIPFIGIIAYGIAEASTAYLITKVTEPAPPPPGVLLPASVTGGEAANGSHAAEEKWKRKELIWTNSDKLLSGTSLDTDGFGDAPDIVPGAWASASAKSTSTELKEQAAQHGYKLSPSPSINSLNSLDSLTSKPYPKSTPPPTPPRPAGAGGFSFVSPEPTPERNYKPQTFEAPPAYGSSSSFVPPANWGAPASHIPDYSQAPGPGSAYSTTATTTSAPPGNGYYTTTTAPPANGYYSSDGYQH